MTGFIVMGGNVSYFSLFSSPPKTVISTDAGWHILSSLSGKGGLSREAPPLSATPENTKGEALHP